MAEVHLSLTHRSESRRAKSTLRLSGSEQEGLFLTAQQVAWASSPTVDMMDLMYWGTQGQGLSLFCSKQQASQLPCQGASTYAEVTLHGPWV